MDSQNIVWCRNFFRGLTENAVWAIPRCGLVFKKMGKKLVLVSRMPWAEGMPVTEEELRRIQREEFYATQRHFEAAGIEVVWGFDD